MEELSDDNPGATPSFLIDKSSSNSTPRAWTVRIDASSLPGGDHDDRDMADLDAFTFTDDGRTSLPLEESSPRHVNFEPSTPDPLPSPVHIRTQSSRTSVTKPVRSSIHTLFGGTTATPTKHIKAESLEGLEVGFTDMAVDKSNSFTDIVNPIRKTSVDSVRTRSVSVETSNPNPATPSSNHYSRPKLSQRFSSSSEDYLPQPVRRLSIRRTGQMHEPKPVFVFEDVCAWSKSGKPLLQGIHGFMHEAEILAVMGPSGGGKTTFLRGITAVRGKDRGITYHRKILARPGVRVGFLGEDHLLLNYLTVKETLRFSLVLDSPASEELVVTKRVNECIRALNMVGSADRQIFNLSAGERKRVQILQLLVRSCNVLIMDEPLGAMDSLIALRTMKQLRLLVDTQRINVILSLHQPRAEVFNCVDFVMIILDGRMCYFGAAHTALTRIQGFLSKAPPDRRSNATTMSRTSDTSHASEPAHLMLDILASTRAKDGQSVGKTIGEYFENSESFQFLLETITTISKDESLHPYVVTDIFNTKLEDFGIRSKFSSRRMMIDTIRDGTGSGLLMNAFIGVVLCTFFTTVFYQLGGDMTINYPTNQAAFFYGLAALIIAMVQLPSDRFCILYNLFRQELLEGTHSLAVFRMEMLATFALPLFYALLAIIPYGLAFQTVVIPSSVYASNLLLAATAQLCLWICIIASNGDSVFSLSAYIAVNTLLLGCDGFVVPPSYIQSPWIYVYYINPRTWYLKANLIHHVCEGALTSKCLSSDYAGFSSYKGIVEALAYSNTKEILDTYNFVEIYLNSYIRTFLDLGGYSLAQALAYSLAIVIFCGLLANVALVVGVHLERIAFRRQTRIDVKHNRILPLPRLRNVVQLLSAASAILILVLSGLFGHISTYYSSAASTAFKFDTTVPASFKELQAAGDCADCRVWGLASISNYGSSEGRSADLFLFLQRARVAVRHMLRYTKNADLLVHHLNEYKPTYKQLNAPNLRYYFDEFVPGIGSGMITNKEGLINLVHSEGRLARIWSEIGGVDNFYKMTSFSTEFPVYEQAAVNNYLVKKYNISLTEALKDGRLYGIVRIPGFDNLPTANHIGDTALMDLNPYALLFRNSSTEDLHTIAIQLGTAGFTQIQVNPDDAEAYGWATAAAFVRHSLHVNGYVGHVVTHHHLLCAVGVSAENTLPSEHAVRQLLYFATRPILYAVMSSQLSDPPNPVINASSETIGILLAGYEYQFKFYRDANFELSMTHLGLWSETDGLYLPLRPMMKELWFTVTNFSSSFVDVFYENDDSVLSDTNLQAFITMVKSSSGGNIAYLTDPSNTCGICTRADLQGMLSNLIFASLRHTLQLIRERVWELFYYPFAAGNLRTSRIPSNNYDFSEEEFLGLFSDSFGVLAGISLFGVGQQIVQNHMEDWLALVDNDELYILVENYIAEIKDILKTYGDAEGLLINTSLEGFPQF